MALQKRGGGKRGEGNLDLYTSFLAVLASSICMVHCSRLWTEVTSSRSGRSKKEWEQRQAEGRGPGEVAVDGDAVDGEGAVLDPSDALQVLDLPADRKSVV